MKDFSLLLYLCFLLPFVSGQDGNISFTSTSPLCIGDPFEMVCFVESSVSFLLMTALVSFNSSTSFTLDQLNSDSSIDGIDLSRYSANIDGLSVSLSRPGIRVIIHSYQPSDSATTFGCHGILNSGTTAALESGKPNLSAAAPSAPSLQSSVSNFNTATCSADISLSWNTPPSDRTVDRYFLHLDGSLLNTTNSNSYIHSTILNINTDYQYSVAAMSCAGNSTNRLIIVNSVASYSLKNCTQNVCISYSEPTELRINWELSTPTQPSGVSGLDITYSLQLLYSHSRQGVTYTYTDSTSFALPSSQLSYNTVLTAHNFTQLDGVETNITANLTIVQQCGQSFSGTALLEYSSVSIHLEANKVRLPVILGSIFGSLLLIVIIVIIICCIITIYIVYKKKLDKENEKSRIP